MALRLIRGPLNSGRRGLVLRGFRAALDRDPVLVVPNYDDVVDFERELCGDGAVVGGSVMTFGGLFGEVLHAAGRPAGPELSEVQRLRAISVAIGECREALGPLRRAAARDGFPAALDRLLDELQASGLDPAHLAAGGETLEGSAYLNDLATLAAGYARTRDLLGRDDAHTIARRGIDSLLDDEGPRTGRPTFVYGFDDLTGNQLELLAALSARTEVTVAVAYEEGRPALAARAGLLEKLRGSIEIEDEVLTEATAANTPNPLLFRIERGFGDGDGTIATEHEGLAFLRSAGTRGEAEAIGAEVAKLIANGSSPGQIAIVLRDPRRRGPLLASVLESYGVPTALEARLPVAGTGVGGALIGLLEAEFGDGRAGDLLRYLRGPSGASPREVDWFERSLRLRRARTAAAALATWTGEGHDLPPDLARLRKAAAVAKLVGEVGRIATEMAWRAPRRGEGDPSTEETGELRAAGAIAGACAGLAELGDLAPAPDELAGILRGLDFRPWAGPVGDRVRIADPYRLRAGRFDHVVVASLQDGEFPRRDRDGDPFLSEGQRLALGLERHRDTEAEERYLFYACLSLPRRGLILSYRESDEDGRAESRSPLLDEVRRLLAPAPPARGLDAVEESISTVRDLTRVVHRIEAAPSERELARSLAARGPGADVAELAAAAGAGAEATRRLVDEVKVARRAESASRAPGPLRAPAVTESLAAIAAHGGTTLEEFDLCSYRWFAGHELDPQPLEPTPDALVQGGLMHAALERLYAERPGGDRLPRPASLELWQERGREAIATLRAERGLGRHPAERAIVRRVERLLGRFLAEEAGRARGGFEPWLLEATFGEREDSDRPVLEIDGWALHGAIDRVDRDPAGNALVLDYKVASNVTPREKFEERAKLQLQLYLLAVAEHWGARVVGGLYHPLRGSSARRPRGAVLDEVADELYTYRLYGNDVVNEVGFAEMLDEARQRAGAIVARMRRGDIRRDPGPRPGLRGHGVCPPYCEFAPICRRDRAPVWEDDFEGEER